ncbi:MAG: hypothetical protein IKY44_06220 [Clostridia bacterium]|nr:hypothetical protein [Clostridia bacterium]
MQNITRNTSFFLESYTPHGLCSYFDGLYNVDGVKSVHLVAGGVRSASSMLIKLVTDALTNQGLCAHIISNPLCTHQPDAVYFPELDACLSNGGESGAFSVKYPIASQSVVSLSPCFDNGEIKRNSQEIKQLFREERAAKLRASGFLSAAHSLMNDSRIISKRCVDADKLSRYTSRLARRELDGRQGVRGREHRRFLSSVTPNGIETYTQSLRNLCRRFYIFSDRYGAVTDYVMGVLKEHALNGGYDVIACYCPMSGGFSVEHLIVPELELCFFSDRSYHSADFIDHRKISSNRFADATVLSEHKKRLRFNKKGAKEMLAEAVKLLSQAEGIRKQLDIIYFSALDKSALCEMADKITYELLNN